MELIKLYSIWELEELSNGLEKRILHWRLCKNTKKQTGFDWHEHEFWGSLCLMSVKLPVVCAGESVSELAVLSLRGLPDSSSLLSVAIVLWMVWYLMGIRVLLLLVTNINTVRLPL